MAAKRKRAPRKSKALAKPLPLADELAEIINRDQAHFHFIASPLHYGTLPGGRALVILGLADEQVADIGEDTTEAVTTARKFGALVVVAKKPSAGGLYVLGRLGFTPVPEGDTLVNVALRLQSPGVGETTEENGSHQIGPVKGSWNDGQLNAAVDLGHGAGLGVRLPVPRNGEIGAAVLRDPRVRRGLAVADFVGGIARALGGQR